MATETPSAAAPRLLLLEFLSDDPYRQLRNEWYPFIQGWVRGRDTEVRWVTLEAGEDSREPDNYYVIDPPAVSVEHLARELRAYRPTVVLSNEKMCPALAEALSAVSPDARFVTVGEDTHRYREILVDDVAGWLGLDPPPSEDGKSRLISDHGVPHYGSVSLNPSGLALTHFTPIMAGVVPCFYFRSLSKNPYFEGVDISEAERNVGCAYCRGDFKGAGYVKALSPSKPAAKLALDQIRRFVRTAPPERRSWRFRVDGALIFASISDFCAGVCSLRLPPSSFHFARRVDDFLARADELEAVLPRLAERGHTIVLWCMGIESFSQVENERMNKGLDVRQIRAALHRLRELEERWPNTLHFFRQAGYSMILFTPWTTLEDLDVNLRELRQLGRLNDVYQLTTRLVLFEGTPMTVLAKHDGLTLPEFPEPFPDPMCGPDFWDMEEIPWRFRNGDVAAAFRFICRLVDGVLFSESAGPPVEDPLWDGLAPLRERVSEKEILFVDLFGALIDSIREVSQPWPDREILETLLSRVGVPAASGAGEERSEQQEQKQEQEQEPKDQEPQQTQEEEPRPAEEAEHDGRERSELANDEIGALLFRARRAGGESEEQRFHVGAYSAERQYFKHSGVLGLWYSHRDFDQASNELSRVLVAAMEELEDVEPAAESVPRWRDSLAAGMRRAGLEGRYEWSLDWPEAAPEEVPPDDAPGDEGFEQDGEGEDEGGDDGDFHDDDRGMDLMEDLHSRMRHEAFIRNWDADYKWRRFLYPVSRCIVDLFQLGSSETVVVHESLECIQNEPPWLPPASSLFRNRESERVGEYWKRFRMKVTDLRARDVAAGGSMKRLEGALEEAADETGRGCIVVHTGCLPNVLGDNPIPAMRRLERKTDARFYWIASTKDWRTVTAGLLADRLEEVAPPETERDPLGVAVVGGASPRENSELLALLEGVGLHPKGMVLPEIGYDEVAGVAEASLFVWANQSTLRDVSDLAFDGLPVQLLRPSAPVGLDGSLAWLRAVAEGAGPEISRRLVALEGEAPWAERLSRLRERAGRESVLFVTDPVEARLYLDSTPLCAFSMLSVLKEMGFRVHFLVHAGTEECAELIAGLDEHTRSGHVSFERFSTREELGRMLEDPRSGAVFSSFGADPRAIEAGINTFSDLDFEMGIEGFFRSAERLLRLCTQRPFGSIRRRSLMGP